MAQLESSAGPEGRGPGEDQELALVVESFLISIESGDLPDVERVIEFHPRIADRLRVCLRNLLALRTATASWPPLLEETGPVPQFEDYEVTREIGRGGMGIVYEARQISLSRTVALKVLPFAAVLDPRGCSDSATKRWLPPRCTTLTSCRCTPSCEKRELTFTPCR